MLDEAGFTHHKITPLGNIQEILATDLLVWERGIRSQGRTLMRPFAPWIGRVLRTIIRTTEAMSLGRPRLVTGEGFDQGYAFRAVSGAE